MFIFIKNLIKIEKVILFMRLNLFRLYPMDTCPGPPATRGPRTIEITILNCKP